MSARANILIFEPTIGGHQMDLIRYLLDGIRLLVANAKVTLLTTRQVAEHHSSREVLSDFADLVTTHIASSVTDRSRLFGAISAFYEQQWRHAELLDRGIAEIGPENLDFILIPYLETVGLLHLVLRPGLFRGKPWATISISIRYHHRKVGITGGSQGTDLLQGIFLRRLLRDPTLVCFGAVNPYLVPATNHPKVAHCVDCCEPPVLSNSADARAAYGIRPETCVVLIFGQIDRRKCVDILLEGAARLIPDLDVTVFLAGRQNPDHIGNALNSDAANKLRAHGRLIEANRFIRRSEDIDPMNAADITWVFYERKFVFSSNVLVKSAKFGRPVIARRQGVIGRLVEDYHCGLTLESDSPEVVADALTCLVRDPVLRATLGTNGTRGFAENTPENFARPMVDAINRALARA